ncbi:NPCBM/NEW2 domain-containing protein, partial [Streptomyces sp. DSM 44917]
PEPEPSPEPTPPAPEPPPAEAAPPAPRPYELRSLDYDLFGNGEDPALVLAESGPVWQRSGVSIAGRRHEHGITVPTLSTVTIALNRPCTSYRAFAGLDDLTLGLGAAVFSVHGDGQELWRSGTIRAGDPAVPLDVPLTGVETLRLEVDPQGPLGLVSLPDWADSEILC